MEVCFRGAGASMEVKKFICPICGEIREQRDKIVVLIEKDCLECSAPVYICRDCSNKSRILTEDR